MSSEFIQVTDHGSKGYVRHERIEAVLPPVEGSPTRVYVESGGWFAAAETPEEIMTKLRDIYALQEAEVQQK